MKHLLYYIKVALKPSSRNIISVLSLALGLALSLVLFGSATYENSYDSFHENDDRLYLVNTSFGNRGYDCMVSGALIPILKTEMPEIEQGTEFTNSGGNFKIGDNKFNLIGIAIDTSFFDVLAFNALKGNPRKDFKEINTIYLSQSKAFELFGDTDPIGKNISRGENIMYTVKGIFEDFPKNSFITYKHSDDSNTIDFLESLSRYKTHDRWYFASNMAVILLKDGIPKEQAESKINQIVDINYTPTDKSKKIKHSLSLLNEHHKNFFGTMIIIIIPLLMALLIAISTALNYSLIAVSSFASRQREFAIHKYSGASRLRIVWIIFIQTAIQTIFALGLAVALIYALSDQITAFFTPTYAILSTSNILNCIYIVLFIIVLSAIIPGKLFSSISIMSLFRNAKNGENIWKKTMLFVLLFLSTATIILATMGYRQYGQMLRNAGYSYDKLIHANTRISKESDFEKYRNELLKLGFVKDVAFSNISIMNDGPSRIRIYEDGSFLFSPVIRKTSENYFDIHEMKIIDGKSYRDGGELNNVVVNERFVEMMNWDKNISPIGNTFHTENNTLHRVIGVVKDFDIAYDALNSSKCSPIVMFPAVSIESHISYANITLKLNKINNQNLRKVEKIIKELNPDNTSIYLNTYLNHRKYLYTDVKKPMDGIGIAGVIIFLISIIGLYGYISNELQYKHREIALRKVYGASVFTIITMIYRPIFIIVCIAVPLGVGAGYFGGDILLNSTLPNVTPMPWWIFASVPLFISVFTYLIVVIRTYKIASRNPVKAIYE